MSYDPAVPEVPDNPLERAPFVPAQWVQRAIGHTHEHRLELSLHQDELGEDCCDEWGLEAHDHAYDQLKFRSADVTVSEFLGDQYSQQAKAAEAQLYKGLTSELSISAAPGTPEGEIISKNIRIQQYFSNPAVLKTAILDVIAIETGSVDKRLDTFLWKDRLAKSLNRNGGPEITIQELEGVYALLAGKQDFIQHIDNLKTRGYILDLDLDGEYRRTFEEIDKIEDPEERRAALEEYMRNLYNDPRFRQRELLRKTLDERKQNRRVRKRRKRIIKHKKRQKEQSKSKSILKSVGAVADTISSYVPSRSSAETVKAMEQEAHPAFFDAFEVDEERSTGKFTFGRMSGQTLVVDNLTLQARVLDDSSPITTPLEDLTPVSFKFAALDHHFYHEDIEAFPTPELRALFVDALSLGELSMTDNDIPTQDEFKMITNSLSLLGIQGLNSNDAMEMLDLYGLLENGRPSRTAFKRNGWATQLQQLSSTVGNNDRSFLSPAEVLACKLYKEDHPDETLNAFGVANLSDEYLQAAREKIEHRRTT